MSRKNTRAFALVSKYCIWNTGLFVNIRFQHSKHFIYILIEPSSITFPIDVMTYHHTTTWERQNWEV